MKAKNIILIVSIVLILTFLAIMFTRTIGLGPSNDAIEGIDSEVQMEVEKLIRSENLSVMIIPSDKQISIKKDSVPRGFGFNINNNESFSKEFSYSISATEDFDYEEGCGAGMTYGLANTYIQLSEGLLTVPARSISDGKVILFSFSSDAPLCTIPYKLTVYDSGIIFYEDRIFVTIKN